jgi:hypothetical protein
VCGFLEARAGSKWRAPFEQRDVDSSVATGRLWTASDWARNGRLTPRPVYTCRGEWPPRREQLKLAAEPPRRSSSVTLSPCHNEPRTNAQSWIGGHPLEAGDRASNMAHRWHRWHLHIACHLPKNYEDGT